MGLSQSDIEKYLVSKSIEPNSLSMIEKRVKAMKKQYRANSTFQLAVKLMRRGVLK